MKINSENIPEENSAKYLALIMDNQTWKEHIHYLNIKLYKSIGLLSKLRHYIPQKLLRLSIFASFQPH